MNNSMISSSVSMSALQKKLDLIAENMANMNTAGYKRKSSVFSDILTSIQPQHEDFRLPERATPLGFTQGWGMRMSSMLLDMTQGTLNSTGLPTDLAIEGNALFEVSIPGPGGAAAPAYTRSGAFQLMVLPGGDRMLVTNEGFPVMNEDGGSIIVPAEHQLVVNPDGTMLAVHETDGTETDLGRLQLVRVLKPEFLRPIGNNLYNIADVAAGNDVVEVLVGLPEGTAVRQGFQEVSNVNLTDEMTELINVQRAYQLSARALASSEQMMGMAIKLRA